jgi:hypothetical protein
MPISRVYVVQETERNILPAKDFGELHVIFTCKEVRVLSPSDMIEKLHRKLHGVTHYDYILCIGNPIAMALTIYVALIYVNRIRVLQWNKELYKYDEQTVNI